MENIDALNDALGVLQNEGFVPDDYKGQVDEYRGTLNQLKEDYELVQEIKKNWDSFDIKKPTQEMVASALAVSGRVVDRLRTLPFLKDIKEFQQCLDIAEKTIDALTVLSKELFEMKDLYLALKAAESNPAAAVQAAWAGPSIAKKGIDFVRWVAPSLDTTQEMKDIENNVFTTIGVATSSGASAGALAGTFVGGPVGAAIGGALGGTFGSIIGAIKIAAE